MCRGLGICISTMSDKSFPKIQQVLHFLEFFVCLFVCLLTSWNSVQTLLLWFPFQNHAEIHWCVCAQSLLSHDQLCNLMEPVRLLCPWDSPQEYWSGLHFLLHGIFLTQGSNPGLLCFLQWQAGILPLVPSGMDDSGNSNQCSVTI